MATGYELVTLPAARQHLQVNDSKQDGLIQSLITQSSETLEDKLGREIITRGSVSTPLVEYHTVCRWSEELFLRDWPIITVYEVAEDRDRSYGSETVLVESTDYIVSKPTGKLIRVNGSAPKAWLQGFRAIRVKYAGGYATVATVPGWLANLCHEHVARMYRAIERKEQGLSGVADEFGNLSRFGDEMLTAEMTDTLMSHAHYKLGQPTGERDA